jgi:hypothetical protein
MLATAITNPVDPRSSRCRFALRVTGNAPSTVHQQVPKILVTPFGDSQQSGFTATGVLARHQPQPGRHVTTVPEGLCVCNRTHQRRRCQHSNSRYRSQALDPVVRFSQSFDERLRTPDSLLQLQEVGVQLLDQFPSDARKAIA